MILQIIMWNLDCRGLEWLCRHILGVQANTWTEYIQTPEHLEYMMFPRALAVAEIGWTSQELRTWEDFKPRMNAHISKSVEMKVLEKTISSIKFWGGGEAQVTER